VSEDFHHFLKQAFAARLCIRSVNEFFGEEREKIPQPTARIGT
jgi:hypothetical protein